MRRRLLAPLLLLAPLAPMAVPVVGAHAAVTIQGPDVSAYQHPGGASINWAKVAKAGHTFAIVKATEGTSYVNHYFGRDYVGIRKAGMVRGSYHFARPRTPIASSALAQARFYVARIGDTNATRTLPPALDLEQTGGLSPVQLVAWAQDFLLDVRALTGRTPMIYTYPWFWQNSIGDPSALARYPLWMAAYRGMTPDVGTTLWQFTAGATVSGIKGRVDMSRLIADPTTWAALSDGSVPTPWPAAAPAAPVSVRAVPAVGRIAVRWLPPDAGSAAISSYRVAVTRADGSQPSRVVTVGPLTTHAVVDGLREGASYLYSVQARNSVGGGAVASPRAPVVVPSPTRLRVSAPPVITYGAPAPVQVTLSRADTGAPIAGATVTVQARAHGGSRWTSYGSMLTDASGSATRTFTPSRNDDFRVVYRGGVGLAAATATTAVSVRKAVTATFNTATSQVGQPVTVTGVVTPAEARTKTALQILTNGAWHNVKLTRTNRSGGFRFVVRPTTAGASSWRVVVGTTPARLAGFALLTLTES